MRPEVALLAKRDEQIQNKGKPFPSTRALIFFFPEVWIISREPELTSAEQ